ncbi:MAG: TetR/AcrR family transcriptional regulator [Spongiibacteraceae bacterium]
MPRLTRAESQNVTRQKLRAAAIREFSSHGYVAASVDRIAESAGFSKGAFYANYPSKQDLMLELMRETSLRETTAWRTLIEVCDDMDAIYRELVARFDAFLKQADWGLFMAEIQLQAKRDKTFGAAYRAYQSDAKKFSNEFFTALFARAGKRLPLPVETATAMLHNLVTGLYLNIGSDKAANASGRAADMLVFFLQSLVAMGTPLPQRSSRRSTSK